MFELGLQVGIPIENFRRMVRLHCFFETAHLRLHVVDLFKGRQSCRMDGFILGKIDMLIKQTELEAVYFENTAGIGTFLAGYKAKNGRLAGTVPPDQPDFFVRIDLERNALQDLVAPVRFLYI